LLERNRQDQQRRKESSGREHVGRQAKFDDDCTAARSHSSTPDPNPTVAGFVSWLTQNANDAFA
jgi:hypothetical protein